MELSLNAFTEFADFSDKKIKIKKENCSVSRDAQTEFKIEIQIQIPTGK